MDDRTALLAAVCDRPDDDTPRLVFADYLDDHGDADSARFIRTQIELSRVPEWDRRWLHAWHRDRDVFSWRRYHAFSDLPLNIRSGLLFRRGFPWNVTLPAPHAFTARADELFALAPFQSLTIDSSRGLPADVGPLADDPRAARLRRLAFVQSRLDAAAVARLADSPHFTGLTELSFELDGITDVGAVRLFRSGLPARLTRLRFHHCALRPVSRGVVGDPGTLRSLVVSGVSMASDFLLELLDAPLFRGLVELDVSHNRLGPRGGAALGASPAAQAVESLTLWRTTPGVAGVRALAGLATLRRLGLRDCDLGAGAARALAESPHLGDLAVLDLSGNRIRDAGALALAASPRLRNLAELDLTTTELTDRGVAALLDSPVTAELVRLGVSGNLSADTVARVRERFG